MTDDMKAILFKYIPITQLLHGSNAPIYDLSFALTFSFDLTGTMAFSGQI